MIEMLFLVGLEAAVPTGELTEPMRPPAAAVRSEAPLVARNALVIMEYRRGGLAITAAGRALGAGNEGSVIRVMNLDTRTTVFGTVVNSGRVRIE